MGLTPWRVVVLLCVAAICVVIAVLDVAAPGVPASCDGAKNSLNYHLIDNAERAYGKILSKEPGRACALQGMKEVVTAWCAWGKTLKEHRATVEAVKVYTTALEDQPTDGGADRCALAGLEEASSLCHGCQLPERSQGSVQRHARQRLRRQRQERPKWEKRTQRPERAKRTQRSERGERPQWP